MRYRIKIVHLSSLHFQSNPFSLVNSIIFTSRQISLKHVYTGMLEDCTVIFWIVETTVAQEHAVMNWMAGFISLATMVSCFCLRPLSEPSVFLCCSDLGYHSVVCPLHRADILSIHISSCFLYLPPLSCFIASIKTFHNHTLLPQFVFHFPQFSIAASSIFRSFSVLVILWSSWEWEKKAWLEPGWSNNVLIFFIW